MLGIRFKWKYIVYKLTAKRKSGHGIHSPFVFDLLTNIINDTTPFYAFDDIDKLRDKLLSSDEKIVVKDLGAGSTSLLLLLKGRFSNSGIEKVKDIVKYSSTNKKYGELLFRLVNYFKPQTLLELGTSLGLGSLYLAMPDRKSILYTIEGCEETAKIARQNFKTSGIDNIKLSTGNFDNKLPEVLKKIKQLDFVFFDGNHKKQPTLSYFRQCLSHITQDTVFVFDDIHWSKEMDEAWNEIKEHKKVTVTIDLFFLGLVFFRQEIAKQHFVIKF